METKRIIALVEREQKHIQEVNKIIKDLIDIETNTTIRNELLSCINNLVMYSNELQNDKNELVIYKD